MKKTRSSLRWLLLSAPLLFASVLMADETEIYFTDKSGDVTPNVLFLIDASGSMTQTVSTDTQNPKRSRMQILKDSFQEVMNTAPPNLNIGLMHYSNHGLGNDYWWSSIKGVNFPPTLADAKVQPLIAPHQNGDNLPNPATGNTTVREFLAEIVNSWSANGYTPIVDSLYEAARYFRGDTVGWGRDAPSLGWAAHPLTYDSAISCTASHQEACVKSWGQCNANIVNGSCKSTTYNVCCNWITTGSDGSGYCKNNNYSCKTTIENCKHEICDAVSGTPKYKSPFEYSCQANYLVLMSDGKPEYPYYPGAGETDGTIYYPPSSKRYRGTAGFAADKTSEIKPAISTTRVEDYLGIANCADKPNGYASGTCGPEITQWLANNDHSTTLAGDQTVKTFTVAFAMADEPTGTAYLQSLATAEDGAFTANNANELTGAFKAILGSIDKAASAFSSPTYTVDEGSLLANSDEVFMPMFNRDNKPNWSGNLKKFARTVDGKLVGEPLVRDPVTNKVTSGTPIVNAKGEFLDTADDLWGAVSGKEVTKGGAASQLPLPDNRKLYTDVGNSTDLTNSVNKLAASNGNITTTLLAGTYITENTLQDYYGGVADGISCSGQYKDCNGVTHNVLGNPITNAGCVNIKEVTTCPLPGSSITAAERTALLDFIRGKKPDGTPRKHMGAILNSKPVVVNYGTEERIFAATNEGFLHSIDTADGTEKWAFMPNVLLSNIKTLYENKPAKQPVYGIDGSLTLWNYDKNLDGEIKATDGDKRVLFFGLRRGGKAYYAIDITSKDNPVLLWKKENIVGIEEGPLDTLGETWSKPTLAKMRVGSNTTSEVRTVVVFGAGYDAAKDTETVNARAADKLGRDVFIVDALTGEIYWSLQRDLYNNNATSNPVKHSIPGDIRVMDMDRNGTLDRLYFADTGGNLWRVDMDADLRDADASMYDYKDAKLTKIAELGDNGDNGTDTRKFFYEPDVALIQHNGQVHMTIALGSGYRTHPLNTAINDRFYVIVDPNVYQEPPASFTTIKNSDLTNARTALGDSGGFAAANDNLLNGNHKGWYYDFDNTGEKVLAPAVSFLNKVVFTTFAPVDETGAAAPGTDPCKVPPNSARAYVLDLFTGRAVANLDRSTNDSKDDFVLAGVNEILDAAKIIFRAPIAADGTACKEGDCRQTVEIRVGKMQVPVMDEANSVKGSGIDGTAGSVDLTDILPRMFWLDHNVSD